MKRPDHPDFWLLSRVLIDTDKASEAGQFEDIISRVIPLDVLSYAADQRTLRLRQATFLPSWTAVTGAWLDGFIAGARFQSEKIKEAHQ